MLDSTRAWFSSIGQNWRLLQYESISDNTTRVVWLEGNKQRWKMPYIIAGICAFALLPLAYAVFLLPGKVHHHGSNPLTAPYTTIHWGPDWYGWKSINHMVVLGDSWSSTGFDLDGEQPSSDNPLGNPAFPGATVTNGENWVDYLLYSYNHSSILAADLAVGGATIDQGLIKPGVPAEFLRSLKDQVGEFDKLYANSSTFSWNASSTLFSVWVGVNDITAYDNETKQNFPREFTEFDDFMNNIYDYGARNFLLFNAPPLDRSPMAPFSDPLGEWPELIDEWNRNFTNMTTTFITQHPDTTVFMFDIHSLFNDVMDTPCLFPETCDFKVTTECCDKYMFGSTTPDYKSPDCEYSIDKYFWINRLHPSTKTHNMTAHVIYDALMIDQSSHG